ncbi:MAG TPA: hypothetical protein VGM64_19575 [Lacunisphaera sp.]|jgi:hypothetical protein
MKSRTTIACLSGLCLAEGAFLVGLLGGKVAYPQPTAETIAAEMQKPAGNPTSGVSANSASAAASAPAEFAKQKQELETKLAEVTKELDQRKSEISFSYGSVRDSGRFVGMTFRKMFEAAAAREASEAQRRTSDNQINVLSLGPFIQDAEVFESDPVSFAQFQGPLVSEVLGLPAERGTEVESLLADLKAKSLKVEEGSAEWMQLNDTALQKIVSLVPDAQKSTLQPRIDFLQRYGVLMIPAYSILRAPTPTVVGQ